MDKVSNTLSIKIHREIRLISAKISPQADSGAHSAHTERPNNNRTEGTSLLVKK